MRAGAIKMWIGTLLLALVVGSSTSTFDLPGVPQVSGRASDKPSDARRSGRLFVEDLPGVVTGRVGPAQRIANSTTINAALARGVLLFLRPNTRIEIGRSLVVPSGAGIIGEAGGAKPVIYLPAANVSNRGISGKYGVSATAINFSGLTSAPYAPSNGVWLENFAIVSDLAPGRHLTGIVGRNVRNCSIRNVEISGIPTGIGIALASAARCTVRNVFIHDFSDASQSRTAPQSTGIEIDNDLVDGVPSSDVYIEGFRIEDLVVSGPLLARWGYQTDGINVANPASRVRIANGRISGVGEGIDTFGSDGLIENILIEDSQIFGLKFVHGASRNLVRNVVINNSGLAGVTFSGSDSVKQDTSRNKVINLTIRGVDPRGVFAANSTAGILIADNGGRSGKPRDNKVAGARIDLGPNGKFGWLDTSTGRGNDGSDIVIAGGEPGSRPVLIRNHAGVVQLIAGKARDSAGDPVARPSGR